TWSVSAVPCASIEAPPISCSVISNSPSSSRTRSAAAPISGPIPSPGSRATRWLTRGTLRGVDVEPDIAQLCPAINGIEDGLGEGLPELLRQMLPMGGEATRRDEVMRIVGKRHRDLLEPATGVGAAGCQKSCRGLLRPAAGS